MTSEQLEVTNHFIIHEQKFCCAQSRARVIALGKLKEVKKQQRCCRGTIAVIGKDGSNLLDLNIPAPKLNGVFGRLVEVQKQQMIASGKGVRSGFIRKTLPTQ